jgi:hypothetical protein
VSTRVFQCSLKYSGKTLALLLLLGYHDQGASFCAYAA